MYSSTPRDLIDLGDGLYAYVQGDGSWGWSNSGLIVSNGESLLVDTLFTGRLTSDMLAAYRRADRAAERIGTLVNTHANGDHTFGNHLVEGARIIASRACAAEMEERPAPVYAEMIANWRNHGDIGAFMHEAMGVRFDFSDIRHTPPQVLFDGAMDLAVGGRAVKLHELGPAHTRGDIVVHVPDAKCVFTGDIVFSGSHPIIWAGPVSNWIEACDLILGWDVETVVPGHGPVGDKAAVRDLRRYLVYVRDAATARFKADMPWDEAAWDIGMEGFDSWLDRERVVANVANIYRDLSAGRINPTRPEIMRQMLRYRRGAACAHDGPCACHG
jgi:glyoxylase-like metal-dependent hydrolase (beta-lactamase superfamily II)